MAFERHRFLHLAAVKTLQKQIPKLIIFTFDNILRVAAEGEKLIS